MDHYMMDDSPRHDNERTECVEEWIKAMLCQECRNYSCVDYLEQQRDNKETTKYDSTARDQTPNNRTSVNRQVDEYCRLQICEWSFRVVDYFDISREVVAISISFLDRFMSKFPCDRRTFKLASVSCLYIACKVHANGERLGFLNILTSLSGGEFSSSQITAMEKIVLTRLGWMVNPPIPSWYVAHYIKMRPFFDLRSETARKLLNMASFYTELAVMDYFFVSKKSSLVGLCALLEAMNAIPLNELTLASRKAFEAEIMRVIPDLSIKHLSAIRSKLKVIIKQSQEAATKKIDAASPSIRSPTCISDQRTNTAYAA